MVLHLKRFWLSVNDLKCICTQSCNIQIQIEELNFYEKKQAMVRHHIKPTKTQTTEREKFKCGSNKYMVNLEIFNNSSIVAATFKKIVCP